MAGVMLGSAQTSQPAQSGQTAPAEKKKNYKDQQEYTLYDSATKEADANKKLALLNTWKEKYPDSDFKMERTQLFLTTYQQLGQPAKMIDAAKEMLAINPKEITALYWITFLAPTLPNTSADALDTAEKAANGLLVAEKPANVKDEDWTKAKSQTDAAAYTTLGWIAMQRKTNDVAEQNFKKALAINPNAAQVSYWLGTVIRARALAETKPERQSEALYDFARAATYDGTGALAPEGRKQIDAYLTKVYTALHGDTSGLAELKAMAKANAMPPPDFKIKTAAEIAAEKEEELKKTNPQLALWLNIKGQLLSPDGQKYFDNSMKGAGLPGGASGVTKFKGWLVSAKEVKSKAGRVTYPELQVSMAGKDQPVDVTLKLVGADGTTAAPLAGKPDVGVEIEYEGIADSFTKEPSFMVTFDVEKSKIVGLKEEKPAPVVHHTAKKKS